ncbi:uncharacterized protein L3040_007226 [Drepanopeziza brunnea f. sp. 'multigermtubi']|nr:hypothetical protein L3040_007226 [Drepanopeziza brunnea f. sp. 'multigermtubi']
MVRRDRPESVISTIFSRTARKTKRETQTASLQSSPSPGQEHVVIEKGSAKEHGSGKKSSSSRRHQTISNPYNFQHVTHTRQDSFPDLHRTSCTELSSEFIAIRASQAPSNELKGIRANDMHFENFSFETLGQMSNEEAPSPSTQTTQQRRKSTRASQRSDPWSLGAHSPDRLGTASPESLHSPSSQTCPVTLPVRTSSRNPIMPFNAVDPLATVTMTRPHTQGGYQTPAPFMFPLEASTHAVTTPGDEAWPLSPSVSGSLSGELTDVLEEEEDPSSKFWMLTHSADLRLSQSVPALRRRPQQLSNDQPEASTSTTLRLSSLQKRPSAGLKPAQPALGFNFSDSWESDIDWCYEHEVEAHCDYQWDQSSAGGDTLTDTRTRPASELAQPPLQLCLQNEEHAYHGRCRPSLSVPSTDSLLIPSTDIPGLSPMSDCSSSCFSPQTPSNCLSADHTRSPCRESFKDSCGFHLSPTLLIPADFHSHVDEDVCYTERYNDASDGTIFAQDSFAHAVSMPVSAVDESQPRTSYRSSDYSRCSARSSSSTAMSAASRDLAMPLRRSSSPTHAHCSTASTSSLPDLIPSSAHQIDLDHFITKFPLPVPDEESESAPTSDIADPGPQLSSMQHHHNKSTVLEQGLRCSETQLAMSNSNTQEKDSMEIPSPVAEAFADLPARFQSLTHERQSSTPEPVAPLREAQGRDRSPTAGSATKRRGSYVLFPQARN